MDDAVWEAVRRARHRLDEANGSGTHELTFRLFKIMEEAGEAANAWIGVVGRNPRKGVTHTREDVAAELADVVLTCLVAIESLGMDARQTLNACAAKVSDRFGAAAGHAAGSTPPGFASTPPVSTDTSALPTAE